MRQGRGWTQRGLASRLLHSLSTTVNCDHFPEADFWPGRPLLIFSLGRDTKTEATEARRRAGTGLPKSDLFPKRALTDAVALQHSRPFPRSGSVADLQPWHAPS